MSKGLNFEYDYTTGASKGPVITLAADEVETAPPDITANVPIANMCSLFQFENINIDNNTSTTNDNIYTGSGSDVQSNSRSLRLDFTPLEQVILGIENKISGNQSFTDDASATPTLLISGAGQTLGGGSSLLNKLPAAALISRDVGDLQLSNILTDILIAGPTYYTKNSATANYSAIIQLFGQASQQGMLMSGADAANSEPVEYVTHSIGFPAFKVIFGDQDYLDITIKYTVSNQFIYKVRQTLGDIRTGGTFRVGETVFTIGSDGTLLETSGSTPTTQEITYKIRFIASNSTSVFNVVDTANANMAARYNTALLGLGELYDNTGFPNGYKFNFNKLSGSNNRVSPPNTFFNRLKTVTDNLKSADGNTTFTSLVTANPYLSRSIFLNGNRLPALQYLNAYIYNTPVSSDILVNRNNIGSLQSAYGLNTSPYLTNTAMVYALNTTLRPQLNNIVTFYGHVDVNRDVNVSTFDNLVVLATALDSSNLYTFTKTGTTEIPTLTLNNSTTQYVLGKTVILASRFPTESVSSSDLFNIGTAKYRIAPPGGGGVLTVTVANVPAENLLNYVGEQYTDRLGSVIIFIPNEDLRFAAAFSDNTAKVELPQSTYALVGSTNTVIYSPSLTGPVYIRKPGSLPESVNRSNNRYTRSSSYFDPEAASVTIGYYTSSSTRSLNRDIKWIEMPRLQPITYAPADIDVDTSVFSYAYLDGNSLKVKFKSSVTNKNLYFYNTALRTGTITTSSDVASISLGGGEFGLQDNTTKNLWIVLESDGVFTKYIIKCYFNLTQAQAANPPGGGNTITSAGLYNITYSNSSQTGEIDTASIRLNGDELLQATPLTAPCLIIITNNTTSSVTRYAIAEDIMFAYDPNGLIFYRTDIQDPETLTPIGPQVYGNGQTRYTGPVAGEIPENNIVNLGSNYYLIVGVVTEAPSDPLPVGSGYVKFFF
jgi:hypothetical protein